MDHHPRDKVAREVVIVEQQRVPRERVKYAGERERVVGIAHVGRGSERRHEAREHAVRAEGRLARLGVGAEAGDLQHIHAADLRLVGGEALERVIELVEIWLGWRRNRRGNVVVVRVLAEAFRWLWLRVRRLLRRCHR